VVRDVVVVRFALRRKEKNLSPDIILSVLLSIIGEEWNGISLNIHLTMMAQTMINGEIVNLEYMIN
jgi:hypothetical protein